MKLVDVISYEGDNRTFVWKSPIADFNNGTQLIVHESQEAVFFLNGRMLDSFGPGRHELSTGNLPLVSRVVNATTGGQTPFHAEIYFVNLTEQLGIPWGTSSKVQYLEPTFKFPLSIGASGEMGLAVRDPRKLLLKIVGTEAELSQTKLIDYFKAFLQSRTKAAIAQAAASQKSSIFELDAHLDELSTDIRNRIEPDVEAYGLTLSQFLVTTVVKPDGDPTYEQMKQLFFRQYADIREAEIEQQVKVIDQQTRAKQTVIEAEARAKKLELEGYTYQQERGFDVAALVAQNEATGEFTNAGMGLGMMAGVGASVGSTVSNSVSQALGGTSKPITPPTSTTSSDARGFCSECGFRFTGTEKFCPQCGTKRS